MNTSILSVLRLHWRRFIWVWLFPILVFGLLLIPSPAQHPWLILFSVGFPAFFCSYYIASKPVRDHRVTIGQGMILIVLVPIIVWATLIFGIFGLAIFGQNL